MGKVPHYCDICKKEIEEERIDAIPETRLCIEHAFAIRKFGGEFTVTATQERTSKPGSLKRNYGGVSTRMVRNTKAMQRLRDEYLAGQ